ncbi:endonuclease domain-containing protein [Streptomyces sp. NBC_01304]|uniref:endonuclease domain-containing protein n=1 Tax=Streptomyces sp. NBC_01304 TaxID=2903818 RepID=UPI002E158597|nr:endonuclease VII domain-containing protein [Streptomyces sp. NBC_01304]WSJ90858.1 endonuclease VII domain-containing protein [Streptomyces sp. NBC_01304]
MLITPGEACRLLSEATEGCDVPCDLGRPSRYDFAASPYVLIGDVVVPGRKHKQRWWLDDRDVRKAGERLAGLELDPEDLVNVSQMPDGEGHAWRSRVSDWVFQATWAHKQNSGQEPSAGITADRLSERYSRRTIACTRPLPLLTWSGTQWLVPRGYAVLLDRTDVLSAEVAQQTLLCSGCGARDEGKQWRSSSAKGFITLCPSCSTTVARPYKGHLQGRLYAAAFAKRSPADAFLCWMCSDPRRALYWDHCHAHGFIRGPLCVRCNNAEGGPRFIEQPRAVEHLLQCTGCHGDRTLPPHHHADVVRKVAAFEPHDSCGQAPSNTWGCTQEDGSVEFQLVCHRHSDGADHRWVQTVPAAQVASIIRDFVGKAINPKPA